MPDGNELACLYSTLKFLPDLGNGHLSHPAIECRFQNVAPIFDRRTLKNMITGIGHGLPRRLLRFVRVRSRFAPAQMESAGTVVALPLIVFYCTSSIALPTAQA